MLKQKSTEKDQLIKKARDSLKKKDSQYAELSREIQFKKEEIGKLKDGYRNLVEELKRVKLQQREIRNRKLDII